MKKILIYSATLLLGAVLWSCSEEKLDSESIFVDPVRAETNFDKYLYREFVVPYNIEVKYRMEDIEIDQQYQVIPANIASSEALTVLMKHLWLDVYSEASPEGIDFVRQYAIRLIHYVGSGQWTSNGVVLGSAEGGKKITMTDVNSINPDKLDARTLLAHYGKFQIIHHEFAHILHQMKNYPTSFQQIKGDYQGGQWVNTDPRGNQDANGDGYPDENYPTAHSQGFVSPYASSDVNEDFVETYSIYITKTPEQWEAFLANAGATGRAYIDQKVAVVRDYMKLSWNMDLDHLRSIVTRRGNEIEHLKVKDLK